MSLSRYCFSLDLKNDPQLISEYEQYHKDVWPEILDSISDSGIHAMEIYLVENRLFMIMEADESFSLEAKNELDLKNEKVQEWERLMWKYQQAIPNSKPGEKWRLMERIFDFDKSGS
jgi:L-rhamnose mutarotase